MMYHGCCRAFYSITTSATVDFLIMQKDNTLKVLSAWLRIVGCFEPGWSKFTIAGLLDKKGINLNIPPKKVNNQLYDMAELITYSQDSCIENPCWIHENPAIGRIKLLSNVPNNIMNRITADKNIFLHVTCCATIHHPFTFLSLSYYITVNKK